MNISANKKLLARKSFFYHKISKNLQQFSQNPILAKLKVVNTIKDHKQKQNKSQQHKIPQTEKELKLVSPITDSFGNDTFRSSPTEVFSRVAKQVC